MDDFTLGKSITAVAISVGYFVSKAHNSFLPSAKVDCHYLSADGNKTKVSIQI